jgi:nucleoid-associated protein YgaU
VDDPEGQWLVPPFKDLDTRPRPDDRIHIVRQGDRLDLLAHKYLGDAQLYWVIALYNNIFWFMDIEMGQELRIPSYTTLHMKLLV